ncbi:MAG TPA: YqgE/AlgH family protein [Opitutaceae bacterium]|jgi:putative transcriptional regulator|nr:YqgE/AlgH family protein [Opitutaceae bacterium]
MRERRQSTKESLAGQLLLAHPAMSDPNFGRTVVLMSAHDDGGAMGVVLNRPLGKHLGELNGEFALGVLSDVPVFQGGPVKTEQLLLAAWQFRTDGFKLYFGIEPDKAAQLRSDEGLHLRAFLGYSGWSRGQLEKELKQNTWVVTPVPGDLLQHSEGVELWRTVLGGMGAGWKLLADEPDDPAVN